MPQGVLERNSDTEFARQVGIVPDLALRLSLTRKLLLAAVLMLAGSTSVFAALFQAGSATGSENFQTCVTTCPMVGRAAQPTR